MEIEKEIIIAVPPSKGTGSVCTSLFLLGYFNIFFALANLITRGLNAKAIINDAKKVYR